LTDLFGD